MDRQNYQRPHCSRTMCSQATASKSMKRRITGAASMSRRRRNSFDLQFPGFSILTLALCHNMLLGYHIFYELERKEK